MRQIFSPLDGFRSPFGRLMGSTAPFTPAVLFGASEPGVWYDPSDLTTLFQDTAGTTPVTTPGQTVALALDKSKGLVLGSETVVSPLAGALGSSYSVVGNTIVRNGSTGTALLNAVGGVASATNKTYLVTFTASGVTGDATGIRVGGGTAYGPFSGDGTFTLRVVGGGVSGSITFIPWGGGAATATYSNISVKELPGFHATQATLASRPTYGIVPLGGRRNLLTFTEQFDNAAWTASGQSSVTANTTTAPNGTTTADTYSSSGAAAFGREIVQSIAYASGSYTISCYVKAGTAGWAYLQIGVGANVVRKSFNVSTGASGSTQTFGTGYAFVSSSISPDLGGGWYRLALTATTPAATANATIGLANADNGASISTGQFNYIWGAQLETGSSATNYQRVGSAFDVTEAGVASLSYLSFDGVDDFLVTPTITPGIDKAQVFAGVRKLSDAAVGQLVELGPQVSINNGSFSMPASDGGATWVSAVKGTGTIVVATATGLAAPISTVNAALMDLALTSGETKLRINGVQVAASTGDAGTGNFRTDLLYLGRRSGGTLPFNGQIYSLLVRFGTNLDAGTITSTETWVGGKTGVTL